MDDAPSKIAVVTGGASGIGAATVSRLREDGMTALAADISPGSDLILDVTDPQAWEAALAGVVAKHGGIDVLVNSAGIAGRAAPATEISVDEWRQVIDLDLSGVFFGCRAIIPVMRRRGYGRIVNVASIAGKEGNPNAVAYSAAKAGVIGLTKAIAKEVTGDGILVNCITPAVIETPILSQLSAEHRAYMTSKIPLGRMGQAAEVAALISWLSSDQCTFSTAAVFDISGGRATY